jgi:hypothetical protein
MNEMRFTIRTHDVFHWACGFARDTAAIGDETTVMASRMAGD